MHWEALMRYFILYMTHQSDQTTEYLIKGKSIDYVLERIERYSQGCLATSKQHINTFNLKSAFVREVNPKDFPYIPKHNYAMINETHSYSEKDHL
jgi:hypothetical protein